MHLIQPLILINRFMLNLRSLSDNDSNNSRATSDAQRFSQFSFPNFRVSGHFLGNIGEPLVYANSQDCEDDELDCDESIVDVVADALTNQSRADSM